VSSIMESKRHRRNRLFCGIDGTPFVVVTLTLAVLLLIVFMVEPTSFHATSGLPMVKHPIPLWGAAKSNALIVSISPSREIFLGNERIEPAHLADGIRGRVNAGAKRKVYIKAYAHVRYETVEVCGLRELRR
jgi:biopolymer transport protein ExbD